MVGLTIGVVVLTIARISGMSLSVDQLRGLSPRHSMISNQPLVLQLVEFTILADFIGYWTHRTFHSRRKLWQIHSVHHSSTQVDWLSSVRVHPLGDLVSTLLVAAPLLLLGFDPAALAFYVPFLTFYAIALHANVGWTYGPLRHVIASPVFHRWHHSAAPEAVNKNFAGLFVFWDLLFRTCYLPKGHVPQTFGIYGNPVPDGFFRQLIYPFRAQKIVTTQSVEPALVTLDR